MPTNSDGGSVELGVVVRYYHYEDVGPEERVALMRAYSDVELADREAARLNSVRREHTEYFVRILRVAPSVLGDSSGLGGRDAP